MVEEVEQAGRLDVEARVVERGEEAAEDDEDQHGQRVEAGEELRHEVDGQQVVVLPAGFWGVGGWVIWLGWVLILCWLGDCRVWCSYMCTYVRWGENAPAEELEGVHVDGVGVPAGGRFLHGHGMWRAVVGKVSGQRRKGYN